MVLVRDCQQLYRESDYKLSSFSRNATNQSSAKFSKERKTLKIRMKIRDKVQLKARLVELSGEMKDLSLENAFTMINVINKRSELNFYKQNRKKN